MLRRLLILLLLVQAMLVLLLADWLQRHWSLAWLAGIGLGLLTLLLLRVLVSLQNFYQSRRHASPVPPALRLTAATALRLFAGELRASLLYSCWSMLFPLGWQIQPAPQTGLPVLLLHGYLCNSGYWRPLSRALRRARISHAALDLEPLWCGIDDYVARVHTAVQRLCAETGSAQVIIVGHSMGGLVARAYLRRHGSAQVAQVVTLGSPHAGSTLAALAPGRNGAQMRIGSDWLRRLAAADPQALSRFTSIYSVHDNMVAPQDSSRLAGARNLAMGGVGHVALAWSLPVINAVLDEIATVRARTGSAAGQVPPR
ncbi:MAG: lipase family alpha/beta hydrolase [Sphingomonadaceae bacterium]